MENIARKIRRSKTVPQLAPLIGNAPAVITETQRAKNVIVLGPDYNNKQLTEEEFERLRSEVCAVVANEMMGDALLVVCNILENKIGGIYRDKSNRMKNFGNMFKEMFREQGKTHSNEFLPLVKRAGLMEIQYGD